MSFSYGNGCHLTPVGCTYNGPWYDKNGKQIFPARSKTMIPDPVDLQDCEHCGKEFPIEKMTMMVDCWFCEGCYADWKAVFDACEHDWHDDELEGESGKLCSKCSGFVSTENLRLTERRSV